jgi:UDP-N-acetylenolpyruvoylglucosamine reductase
MDTTDIIYNCAQKLDCDARRFEPMSRHTSFKIGGKADVYIKVTNLSQLMKILKECDVCKEKYILLGNGSNVLVPDEGIHGTVLRLDGDFRNISLIDDTTIYCGAGAALGSLCKFAQKCGLSGLEFAWGIPGTVGGALFMNAGAYGGEVTDIFGRLAIECSLGSSSDFYGIIGNKTVTTLNKLNCGFTLTDAAVARKQTAFAVHFNKNAMTGDSRSKLFVKILYK